MSIVGHRVLNLFELLPANVALVRVANQCPIGLSVYVDSGVVLLPAHTALHALSCRTHTRPRTPDCSTSYRWWCTVVVSTRPGRAGQKPEPAVRVRETTAMFAVLSQVRGTC